MLSLCSDNEDSDDDSKKEGFLRWLADCQRRIQDKFEFVKRIALNEDCAVFKCRRRSDGQVTHLWV